MILLKKSQTFPLRDDVIIILCDIFVNRKTLIL